jgi:hypothetical protein
VTESPTEFCLGEKRATQPQAGQEVTDLCSDRLNIITDQQALEGESQSVRGSGLVQSNIVNDGST